MLADTNRKKRNPKKSLPFLSENQERAVQKTEKFYTTISLLPANTTENTVASPTPASRLTAPAGCERSPEPLRGEVKAGWVWKQDFHPEGMVLIGVPVGSMAFSPLSSGEEPPTLHGGGARGHLVESLLPTPRGIEITLLQCQWRTYEGPKWDTAPSLSSIISGGLPGMLKPPRQPVRGLFSFWVNGNTVNRLDFYPYLEVMRQAFTSVELEDAG